VDIVPALSELRSGEGLASRPDRRFICHWVAQFQRQVKRPGV
jgi:hypothetical protein